MRWLTRSACVLSLTCGTHCGTDLFTAPEAEISEADPGGLEVATTSVDAGSGRLCATSTHSIAFISNRAGAPEWQLYLMDAAGGAVMSLSRGHFRGPVWSPDGGSIAFRYHHLVEYQADFSTEIGIMAADGSERVSLARDASGRAARLSPYRSLDVPSWSADAERLAFASQRGAAGEFRAWVVSRWGGAPELLLPEFPGEHAWPSFSPLRGAGARVAIVSRAEGSASWIGADVWVADVESSALPRNVTQGRVSNPEAPRWSPDGERLAFSAETVASDAQSREIYVVELDSGALTRVTSDETADVHAAWSPDGSTLLVSSERQQEGREGRLGGEEVGLWLVPLAAPDEALPLTPSAGGHGVGDWLWTDACTPP
jgi:Tol biopolymer transport system component